MLIAAYRDMVKWDGSVLVLLSVLLSANSSPLACAAALRSWGKASNVSSFPSLSLMMKWIDAMELTFFLSVRGGATESTCLTDKE